MLGTRHVAAWLIFAAMISIGPAKQAVAQIAMPEPIDARLPESWREPLAQFLREFGASDIGGIVEATKAVSLHHLPNTMILRLEHSSACFTEICLTIICQLKDDSLHSQAMFFAGKWTTSGDVFPRLLGTNVSTPLLFYTARIPSSDTKYVALSQSQQGWVISIGPMQ